MKKKRLYLIIFLTILVLTLSFSAQQINKDNKKQYNNSTKTLIIKDKNDKTILQAQRITPQINYVMRGNDRLVAEYIFSDFDKSKKDFSSKIEFYSIKQDMRKFDRNYKWKYAIIEEHTEPTYKLKCEKDQNSLNNSDICIYEFDKNITKEIKKWIEFKELSEIPYNTSYIGLFTDVYSKENIEYIPTFFDIEITEDAQWIDSFEVGLTDYFPMDNYNNSINSSRNLILVDGTITFNSSAKYGNSSYFNEISSINISNSNSNSTLNFSSPTENTLSFWVYPTRINPNQGITLMSRATAGGQHGFILYISGVNGIIAGEFYETTGKVANNTWTHIVLVSNFSGYYVYINGTFDGGSSAYPTGNFDNYIIKASDRYWNIGSGSAQSLDYYKGYIDEIAIWNRSLSAIEINNLWDNSTGTFWVNLTEYPSSTLISPIDNTLTNINKYEFICHQNSSINILANNTLQIWNSSNNLIHTNFSTITGVTNKTNNSFIFSYTGTFYWNCLTYNNKSLYDYRTANFTIYFNNVTPIVVLNSPTNNKNLSYNTNIYFNYTPFSANGLDTCKLYGNWSGTWKINSSVSNPTNNSINFINISTIPNNGNYKWNVECNDTFGNLNFYLINNTFTVDTSYPLVTIDTITTTAGSQTISFNHTINDLTQTSCKYSLFNQTGGMINSNVSFSCNNNPTSATVNSSYGTYDLTIYAKDMSNLENSSTGTFTINASSGGTTIINEGGGGSSSTPEPPKVFATNFSILTTNYKESLNINLPKKSVRPRKANFLVVNKGIETINLEVVCDTEGVNLTKGINICDYVEIENKTLIIPPNEEIYIIGTFKISTPEKSSYGDTYYFNLLAIQKTSDEWKYSKLSISSKVSFLAIIYKYSYFPFFQKNKEESKKVVYPVALVSLIASFVSFILFLTILSKVGFPKTGFYFGLISFFLVFLLILFFL